VSDLELTNTGVFKAIGKPHLPPGPLMVAEAAASATMLEQDRRRTRYQCSLCDSEHDTYQAASDCCGGIVGEVEADEP
jgi:hypothetical protein